MQRTEGNINSATTSQPAGKMDLLLVSNLHQDKQIFSIRGTPTLNRKPYFRVGVVTCVVPFWISKVSGTVFTGTPKSRHNFVNPPYKVVPASNFCDV